MTKRLNGANKADSQYPRDPYGYYIETRASVEQLFDVLDFGDSGLIWDPSCGSGNILDVAASRGFDTIGSDVVDRYKPGGHRFFRGNFLHCSKTPTPSRGRLSIVNNPPYNEPTPGLAEDFIAKAVADVAFFRAAFLVPLEFQCGQGRYDRLFGPRPSCGQRPSHVISLMERPSMPPGAAVEDLGDRAFKGGMAEYAWIVWSSGGPHRTEHLFAPPTKYREQDLTTRRNRVQDARNKRDRLK